MSIPVVDIFAGPGGLGEGFSAFSTRGSQTRPFRIAVSAEMEPNAAKTLRLRAFFRQFEPGHAPASYYDYVAGRRNEPWTNKTLPQWQAACEEALQLELGVSSDDQRLHERIDAAVSPDRPWVLIGGPPCQAYSIAGRVRNLGVKGYSPAADHRHFLYQHYLRIINRFRPAAFVMENVKGILSSKVDGELMFPRIIDDLTRPGGKNGPRYRVLPLVISGGGLLEDSHSAQDFVLRAEMLGVPQARHRVVILGLAHDVPVAGGKFLQPIDDRFTVADVIGGLPRLRSEVTDLDTSHWHNAATDLLVGAAAASRSTHPEVAQRLIGISEQVAGRKRDPGSGGRWALRTKSSDNVPHHLRSWLLDKKLDGVLNHEVRAHMSEDLMRYAFASAFASVHGHSPRGAKEFPKDLHPAHKNWKSGNFVDRFKVQMRSGPSSTITSHISKDGHYFIHPDSSQLRSLSVREAARLQTFPDNYFFEGARSAQFKQVGNAVPPWLAKQIAESVYSFLSV